MKLNCKLVNEKENKMTDIISEVRLQLEISLNIFVSLLFKENKGEYFL